MYGKSSLIFWRCTAIATFPTTFPLWVACALQWSPVHGHWPAKGRDTKERALRNFGMCKPEGYRKALRLMKTAEKFRRRSSLLSIHLGHFRGLMFEERGQSEAIGRNIFEMVLEVPIITKWIGEGGSGGALAISVADQTLMLQYAVYSVISPRGVPPSSGKLATRPKTLPKPWALPPTV